MHGYSPGFHPNPRECYRMLVDPAMRITLGGKPADPVSTFTYCAYMPVNRKDVKDDGAFYNSYEEGLSLGQHLPAIPPEVLKSKPKADRPMAWLILNEKNNKRQLRVFKRLMFADVCKTISIADQQDIINRYYGVDLKGKTKYTMDDTEQVEECKAKRPRSGSRIVGRRSRHTLEMRKEVYGTHCSHDANHCAEGKQPNDYTF